MASCEAGLPAGATGALVGVASIVGAGAVAGAVRGVLGAGVAIAPTGVGEGPVAVGSTFAADVESPPPRIAITTPMAATAMTAAARTSSKMRERPIRLLHVTQGYGLNHGYVAGACRVSCPGTALLPR